MHILLRKLNGLHTISEEEQAALLATLSRSYIAEPGTDIVAEGSLPKHTTVLLAGTACRYKMLPGGERQVLAFQYPGDMTDLYSYVMKKMDHAISALGRCEIANINHDAVEMLSKRYPNLAYTFWRDTMVDASISYSWAVGGARKTPQRVANLLCEVFARLNAVGLARVGEPLPFDATQRDLANAIGLSLVHMNKTLGGLRRRGFIRIDNKRLVVSDWDGLRRMAGFDPAYLHFRNALAIKGPR